MALGRFAVALSMLSVSSAAAIAADMSLPPRPYAPYAPAYYHSAVVYEWTGFYVGLSAGGGFGLGGVDNRVTSVFCNITAAGCDPDQASSAAAAAVPAGLDKTHPSGFIGGGQIGYNYQMGWFVWGVEADFSGADISGSNSKTVTATVVDTNTTPLPTTIVDTISGTAHQKLDWFGTLRGRVGFVPFTPLLVYATGGLAYGHVSADTTLSETATVTGISVPVCPCSATSTASTSSTQFGWTVGGGAEWMFAPHWSLKAEFLYYDLGHVSADMTLTQLSASGVPFTTIGITSRVNFNGDIARGGINYRF
jgi:outer membrane immunogenic protein